MALTVPVTLSGMAVVDPEALIESGNHGDLLYLARLIEERITKKFQPLIEGGLTEAEKSIADGGSKINAVRAVKQRTRLSMHVCVDMVNKHLHSRV